jgi:hypothetical protein
MQGVWSAVIASRWPFAYGFGSNLVSPRARANVGYPPHAWPRALSFLR